MHAYRSKYTPLEGHLRKSGRHELPMSFAKIEQVIGTKLPPSARKHRPWWSNNPSNSVITRAWLNAGYKTAQVDMDGERLVFVKDDKAYAPRTAVNGDTEAVPVRRHPVFGCMKNSMTVAKDVDLSQPAMPEWVAIIENPALYNE